MANLANLAQWQQFSTLVYGKGRERLPELLPNVLSSAWVRIEISVLGEKPGHYQAGWLNQIVDLSGKKHQFGSFIVPLQFSSLHSLNNTIGNYQLVFAPVTYLPHCVVRFYRFIG